MRLRDLKPGKGFYVKNTKFELFVCSGTSFPIYCQDSSIFNGVVCISKAGSIIIFPDKIEIEPESFNVKCISCGNFSEIRKGTLDYQGVLKNGEMRSCCPDCHKGGTRFIVVP